MNERDYMILEVMSIVVGLLSSFTLMIVFLFLSPDLLKQLFLLISFIVMFTFLMAVAFHYKRKIYIMQMEQELVSHRKDFEDENRET